MATQKLQIADKPTLDEVATDVETLKAEIEELKTTLASMSEMLSGGGEEILRKSMTISSGSTSSMQIDGCGKVILSCVDGDISFTYFKIIADDVQFTYESLAPFRMRTAQLNGTTHYIYEIPIMKYISVSCTVPTNTSITVDKINAIAIIKE